jgi:2-keto-4-pentenoate hydratase/2-oxohepta-3-ene-1,7-dioic acid hydratase in catechol pathway
MREMQQGLGPAKGKDTATTIGPVMVTRDELLPLRKNQAFDLKMTASVNGKEYSRANVSDVYWSFEEMLAYASRGTMVRPGDIIGSGTCGTGCILELSLRHGLDAYPWLKPGDEVEMTVERIGTIKNKVVEGPPFRPLRPAK